MSDWIRSGRCQPDVCGAACCKRLGIPSPKQDDHWDEYLDVRGIPRRDIVPELQVLTVEHRCPQLTTIDRCRVEPHKPKVCRDFPTHPSQLVDLPDCTYSFAPPN